MKQMSISRRDSPHDYHWNIKWLFRKQVFLMVVALLFTSLQLLAQVKKVTGMVHDDKGQPVSGARVVIRGTAKGTTTGSDGKFSIRTPGNATLVISNVGFATQEIALKGQPDLNVQLDTSFQNLTSIVVVA
jgi:hypothetical protein